MSVSGPLLTIVPPSIVVQNSFWASTFLTTRWMCPRATPMSLGGASCASAGVDVTRAMHPARARSRRFMSGLRSGTRLHEVDIDPGRRRAYGLDYADAPEADLDLCPRGSRNTCSEFD